MTDQNDRQAQIEAVMCQYGVADASKSSAAIQAMAGEIVRLRAAAALEPWGLDDRIEPNRAVQSEPWLDDILNKVCADYAEITISADIPVCQWDDFGIDAKELYGEHRWAAAVYTYGDQDVYGTGPTREAALRNAVAAAARKETGDEHA